MMSREDALNVLIKSGTNTNLISDGYHTFGELYDHRITLWIALCRWYNDRCALDSTSAHIGHYAWRSKLHSDGSQWDGWFLLGLNTEEGEQITYHLPIKLWMATEFARTFERAPKYDGHTPSDVLERLAKL